MKSIYFLFLGGFDYLFCYRVPSLWPQAGLLSVKRKRVFEFLVPNRVLPQTVTFSGSCRSSVRTELVKIGLVSHVCYSSVHMCVLFWYNGQYR